MALEVSVFCALHGRGSKWWDIVQSSCCLHRLGIPQTWLGAGQYIDLAIKGKHTGDHCIQCRVLDIGLDMNIFFITITNPFILSQQQNNPILVGWQGEGKQGGRAGMFFVILFEIRFVVAFLS